MVINHRISTNLKGEEDCATLASGENHPSFWNDAPCSGTYGALCKSTVNPNNENPPLLQTCDNEGLPDFFRFNGACYKWMDVPKTWDEAEQDCKSQHSSHLVSIPTDMEQSYVFANAQQSQAWIGLSNKEVVTCSLRHYSNASTLRQEFLFG